MAGPLKSSWLGLLSLAALTLGACGPQPAADTPRNSAPSRPQDEAARAPKTITIGIQREPGGLHQDLSPFLTGGGNRQVHMICHNYLVVRNLQNSRIPQLAQEVISVEKGTWRVNPDGTMDTTWKLRPNVKWQDGKPFTSDDLMFTFSIYKDPDVPNTVGPALRAMESATAPDPLTFIVHWSSINIDADLAPALIPVPRHLVEDTFKNDKAALGSSSLFGPDFVGLGPYRLTRWETGSQMEFSRFDDYYLGRPPFDTVTLRFVAESTAMIATILAGAIDVVLPQGPDVEAALEVKRRWEGTGNQVTLSPNGTIRYIQFQHRPEYQRPRNAFSQRLVRQAFTNATDRQAGIDVTTEGTAPIAESWFPPTDQLYPQVQSAIPKYPFDLNLAQQRLAQAGWIRAPGGELVHQPSGERFELEFRGLPGSATERLVATVLDTWKATGAQPEIKDFPPAIASDPEFRVTFPGAGITGNVNDMFSTGVLDSRQMATAATRWVGNNRSGYSNPAMNALYDKLSVTIAPTDRITLQRAMVEEAMGDAAFIPLYFDLAPVFSLKGVRNIGEMVDNSSTWNMFEWNKD